MHCLCSCCICSIEKTEVFSRVVKPGPFTSTKQRKGSQGGERNNFCLFLSASRAVFSLSNLGSTFVRSICLQLDVLDVIVLSTGSETCNLCSQAIELSRVYSPYEFVIYRHLPYDDLLFQVIESYWESGLEDLKINFKNSKPRRETRDVSFPISGCWTFPSSLLPE